MACGPITAPKPARFPADKLTLEPMSVGPGEAPVTVTLHLSILVYLTLN
jgi:hypothetical protein